MLAKSGVVSRILARSAGVLAVGFAIRFVYVMSWRPQEKRKVVSLTFALINEFGEGTFGNERHVGLFMTMRFKGVDTGDDSNRLTYVRKGMDKCHRPTCISDL